MSSFPSTAFLKSLKSSDGINRLGPFEGFMGALAFVLVAPFEGLRRVFWRSIGFKGIRGGSISVHFRCDDALAEMAEVMGLQYEVE